VNIKSQALKSTNVIGCELLFISSFLQMHVFIVFERLGIEKTFNHKQ